MTAGAAEPPEQILKEAEFSLALLDDLRAHSRRGDVPGSVWLRAARASWIVGNEQWARDFYKSAAPALITYAHEAGRRIGAFAQYAALALGAAWMSQDRDTLLDVCKQADSYADRQLNNLDNPPDPLIRVTLLLTRVRVAWYRGQKTTLQEHLPELERRANQLDATGKAFWTGDRGAQTLAFYKVIYGGNRDQIQAALRELDRRLESNRAKPPTISDLVDEEFISFARKMEDLGIFLPKVVTPTTAGEIPAQEERR
jgi:hypothetical protein